MPRDEGDLDEFRNFCLAAQVRYGKNDADSRTLQHKDPHIVFLCNFSFPNRMLAIEGQGLPPERPLPLPPSLIGQVE